MQNISRRDALSLAAAAVGATAVTGAGIKAEIPGKAPTWTGAFANVVFNF